MSTPRILIVDDDPATLRSYLRMLHDAAPLQAADGLEAREILTEMAVDIVVCDLGLPGMDGLELMQWAKEHCPHPLWIVVSGKGTFDAAIQALKLGAFDFICKPLQTVLQLQTSIGNATRHQALVTDSARMMRSLAENNLRISDSNHELEKANAALNDQQKLLDQDLRRAERIVHALLPRSLALSEQLQLDVAYRPSKTIGGDFYGAAMRDDHHLAIYVADAAGHGVSAALLAVLFHQRLAMLDAGSELRSPAAILSELNHALLEECLASGLFVSAAYVLVDLETRIATIASAGHPPVIVLHQNGATELVEHTGPVLGLARDASYLEHQVALAEGDRLFLYTDGLTEAISKRAPRLETILASITKDAKDESKVLQQLLTWTERGESLDDMTMLLVTAAPAVAAVASPPICEDRLWLGSDASTMWIVAQGRTTWKQAAVLRARCIETLDAGRAVILDLGDCAMLDSTVLGTLHEIVVRARGAFRLQHVGAAIRGVFEELALTQLLASIDPVPTPLPALTELASHDGGNAGALVLRAHELRAGLSPHNAAQFQPVVDSLGAFDTALGDVIQPR